jgi:hypothetical protein
MKWCMRDISDDWFIRWCIWVDAYDDVLHGMRWWIWDVVWVLNTYIS